MLIRMWFRVPTKYTLKTKEFSNSPEKETIETVFFGLFEGK